MANLQPVGKVTRQKIKIELKKLSNDKAPAALKRYKSSIGSLYSFVLHEFDIDYNPVKGIKQYTENNVAIFFSTDG